MHICVLGNQTTDPKKIIVDAVTPGLGHGAHVLGGAASAAAPQAPVVTAAAWFDQAILLDVLMQPLLQDIIAKTKILLQVL